MKEQEYETIMFHNDAVVEGSRMRTSDKIQIKLSCEFAIFHGYTFSSKKVS